jgi:hypothetical protein
MKQVLFHLKQILIALDQFCNTLLCGYADETFSARCWRGGKRSKVWNAARITVDCIFWFDRQHCFASYVDEFERKQLPKEYRGTDLH